MSNRGNVTYGIDMTDEYRAVTANVTKHVERAERAIKAFRMKGVTRKGVLLQPLSQAAALKVACEELGKAIAAMESTNWV